MTVMAAVCGVMIVLLGFWSTGRAPTEAQSAVEIICLVGGLILCFMAVVLSRLNAIAARLDGYDIVDPQPAADDPEGRAAVPKGPFTAREPR